MAKKKSKWTGGVSLEQLRTDERCFIEGCIGDEMWDVQAQIVKSVMENERTAVKSCHGSGKTWTAARIVLWFLFTYYPSKVITTAPTFTQIKEILWREIKDAHSGSKFELPGKVLDTTLNLDDQWFAIGRSTNDPTRMQGFHSPHVLVVGDEASGIPRDIFEAIEGAISTDFIRFLLIGNPTDPSCYFSERFKKDGWNKFTISAFDTPNFKNFKDINAVLSSTEEDRRKAVTHPYLITPNWVYQMHEEYGIDHPAFEARVYGNFPRFSTDTLISLADAEFATRNNDIKLEGERVLGIDVARFGSDKTAYYGRQGGNIFFHDTDAKRDLMYIANKACALYHEHKFEIIGIDDTGLGGGVTDRLKELGIPVFPINFASSPQDKTLYTLIKDEMYWELRDMFIKREIRIPEDSELVGQLTGVKYTYKNGKLKMESKADMKNRGVPSPDKSDALAICMYTSQVKKGGFANFMDQQESLDKKHFQEMVDNAQKPQTFADFLK